MHHNRLRAPPPLSFSEDDTLLLSPHMSLDLESLKRFSQWSVKESVKESLEQSLTQIFFVISPQLKQKGHKSKSEPPFKSSEVGWWHLFQLITSLAKA